MAEGVPEVLTRFGWPLGSDGRTKCPIHQGESKTAFQYATLWWRCHRGCGHGNALGLAERLGLPMEQSRVKGLIGLEAILSRVATAQYHAKPSVQLDAQVRERAKHRLERAEDAHARCWMMLDFVTRGLNSLRDASRERQLEAFEAGAELARNAYDELDRLHGSALRGCPCRG